jgi:hypothetical protein
MVSRDSGMQSTRPELRTREQVGNSVQHDGDLS